MVPKPTYFGKLAQKGTDLKWRKRTKITLEPAKICKYLSKYLFKFFYLNFSIAYSYTYSQTKDVSKIARLAAVEVPAFP